MRIDPNEKIMGFNSLKIRELLKKGIRKRSLDKSLVESVLGIEQQECDKLLKRLESNNYIEKHSISDNTQHWIVSNNGRQLAKATAAKPIKRETARNRLNDFLDRVKEVNGSDYYLYHIDKVILFGSYLEEKERINDVDIALKTSFKGHLEDKVDTLLQRANEAANEGRRFSTLMDKLAWGEDEIMLYLKNRSRSLSLHSAEDEILNEAKTKVIYSRVSN